MSAKDFVIKELDKIALKRVTPTNVVICCPFHKERTPSFSINIDESNRTVPIGFGHCFSGTCGRAARWNVIAHELGLDKLDENEEGLETSVRPLQRGLKGSLLGGADGGLTVAELMRDLDGVIWDTLENWPSYAGNRKWRGFDFEFLTRIGCLWFIDRHDFTNLMLPVYVEGNLVGGVKAKWQKSKDKKFSSYINMSGPWVLETALFPYDYVVRMIDENNLDYVILVEGARDALRLIKFGFPALAILGTKTWSDKKADLILALGVRRVVIMMDGDSAGVEATNEIAPTFKHKCRRSVVKLKEYNERAGKELDPGNMPVPLFKEIVTELGLKRVKQLPE